MKTAMQELIEILRKKSDRHKGDDMGLAYDYAIEDAEELLQKEKDQMISMCSIGSRNPGIEGEDVFNKTFNSEYLKVNK